MKKHLAFFLCLGLLMSANVIFAQPANDDCGGSISLTVAADEASATPVSGTTTGATASGATTGSPISVCSGSWFVDDVWYSFTTGATVPQNGITVKVIPGTFGILGMAIYTSCDTGAAPIQCMSQQVDDFMSIPFVLPNTTYQVRMWSGGGGTLNAGTFDIITFENFVDPNAAADVVLWGANPGEGDFDGGLNGWTSNAITTGDDWIWEADATSNGAFGNATILSPTASNGAMLFDADFMTTSVNPSPTSPYPQHTAELLSPIIDCSAMPTLSVKFNQVTRGLNGDTFFSYSIDGGVTFSTQANVNSGIAANVTSPNPGIKRFDMPNASGSSQVQLKFTADMDFYYWILDDVQLVEKEGNNLTLANDFIAVAPTYAMPQSSIDTIRFLADVANIGASDATNVMLTINVVRDLDGVSVFTAMNPYGDMMSGDTIENQTFSTVFVPDTTIGSYTATYTLSSDSIDAFPGNNLFIFQFEIVADYFDKIPTFTRNVTPSADNSYTYGTTYQVFDGTTINGNNDLDTLYRYVSAVSVGVANPDELAGQSMTVFIEKPAVGNQYIVDINGDIIQADRSLVGFGLYTFTGNEPDNFIANIPVEDFSTGELLALESGVNYIVAMQYIAPDATTNLYMLAAQGEATNYAAANFAAAQAGVQRFSQILDVGNSSDYGTVGFTAGITPLIRLNFFEDFKTSTKAPELDVNALTIFPNPAAEFITANIELEDITKNANFTIYNVTGQVVETRNLSNVQNERVVFDLGGYTSGSYFISVTTDEGYTIKRFIVTK